MRMYDIIKKKRDGLSLSRDEIHYFIREYTRGSIPDYQASALLMAIFLNNMDEKETLDLTEAMVKSGDRIDLSDIRGTKVDKHSTGGVGDSTTLILGPMIAACGVPFIKMSGRGLGHTGGTLDKLESIKGFRVDLESKEFISNSNEINICISSQTANITPADKKIYALRDVTATVDNLSFIASSIMSKKLAIQSDGIVLDVKFGSGAFMKSISDARALAREMVRIGENYGRKTEAVLTNMDQPLGRAIGNALEVKEAVELLQGNGPNDLLEICLVLGSKLLILAGKVNSNDEGRNLLLDTIESGKAYDKFLELVRYQDGDTSVIQNLELLPSTKYIIEVQSRLQGYVKEINAEEIGQCSLLLGAGRETLDTELDLGAGITLNKKIDDQVNLHDTLAYIHTNDIEKGNIVKQKILNIYKIGERNSSKQNLIINGI